MKTKRILYSMLAAVFALLLGANLLAAPSHGRALLWAVGFAAFLILAIRAGRRKPQAQSVSDMPPLEVDDDLPQRVSSRGYWIAALCAVLAVAMIVATLPTAPRDSLSANTRVLSGRLEEATISTVLSATGTLAAPEAEAVSVPQILEVETYHVKNGARVAAGDILASVRPSAVSAAIVELQSVLDELDAALAEAKNAQPSANISATTPGRVKRIYAQPEDDVASVVYENGALLLLSLDGFMALTLETALPIGTDVTVTLADGTQEPGSVISSHDGKATVTLSDARAADGEEVTVTTADGTALGGGALYVHSPLRVVGYYGTVATVPVRLNQTVYENTVLFTLKNTGYTQKYHTLLDRRQELETQMDALLRLSQDGCVRAQTAGIVSGIDANADYTSLTASWETPRIQLLAAFSPDRPVPPESTPQESTPEETEPPTYSFQVAMVMKRLDANTLVVSVLSTQDIQEGSPFDAFAGDPTKGAMTTLFNSGQAVRFCDGSSWVASTFGSICEGDVLLMSDEVGLVFQRSSSAETPIDISGMLGGLGGYMGGPAVVTTPAYETYNAEQTDILSITPQDTVTVALAIDELDILSLHEGMEAAVTLDALQGQALTGTISRIHYYGTNEGGNTKYTVEVTLPRTESMLEGMNASVKVVTAVSQSVLTVPAEALQEISGKTWLYTAYDSKKDELGGLVQVQTGISDGARVQILSGLEANTAFYYRYADTLEYQML